LTFIHNAAIINVAVKKFQFPWLPQNRVNVGRRVKRWRKHNRLTQKEAAERLGISIKTIQDYEQERRGHKISYHWYNMLIELTKVSPRKSNKKKA
jgi:DNA-binding XRE family transcriptional regulator